MEQAKSIGSHRQISCTVDSREPRSGTKSENFREGCVWQDPIRLSSEVWVLARKRPHGPSTPEPH